MEIEAILTHINYLMLVNSNMFYVTTSGLKEQKFDLKSFGAFF